ncbi:MAG: type II toxin-antitoxin system RelB/DinJ family antitoxin [Candidatus Saccharibacteria bacterium]|nr:type II toxin-antitoxin system RelB/DinJ family antitoxin [Candidatus Saccharibacteria bacterium]
MASTNDVTMTIRTNSEVKKTAAALFDDLGLDMSSAINMFLRECIRKDGIPFEVSRKEIPNLRTRRAIKNAVEGKNMVGPFKTVEEAMDYLNA